MRDLIACLYIWLGAPFRRTLHATIRRAAAYLATPKPPAARPTVPPAPAYARRPLPEHIRERFRPLDGETIALVRPYLATHERRVEQRLQRERRTAAVLATAGIDYDIVRVAV